MSVRSASEAALAVIADWAAGQEDVRAVALVGSVARGTATDDSDLDLVVLVTEPSRYASSGAWLNELGLGALVRTAQWGPITEQRVALPSGLEVEVGIGPLDWASTEPVDAGTRRVVRDGMRIVYDPDDHLARLAASVLGRPEPASAAPPVVLQARTSACVPRARPRDEQSSTRRS